VVTIAVFGLPAAGACTLVLGDAPEQCQTRADCATPETLVCQDGLCLREADIAPLPIGWECLADPEPLPKLDGMFVYQGRTVLIGATAPPADTSIRLCHSIDVRCDNPVEEHIAFDDLGVFEVEISGGFEGYFEITSDITMPLMLWVRGPVTADQPLTAITQLVPPTIVDILNTEAGVETDPERGVVVLLASNCADEAAAGVQFSLEPTDAQTVEFYTEDALPRPGAGTTDISGLGGFVNVRPGVATALAKLIDADLLIAERRFFVRAHWITTVPAGARP